MSLERLKGLLAEYGPAAVLTYLAISVASMVAFSAAIAFGFGFDVQSAHGAAGTLAGAWVASKAIQPLRIAATLVLTPVVARVARKLAGKKPAEPPRQGESS